MSVCPLGLLQKAPLLNDVGHELITQISQAGRVRTLKRNFGRIGPDEMSKRLFFVLSGEMRMMRMAPDGQEHLIQRFNSGEFFCLSALVSSFSCNSQMVNAGSTELMYWGHDVFRQFMDANPHFYGNILHQMASQVEQEREMRTLSRCCKADIKVAAYLLHKIKQGECTRKLACSLDLRPISLTAQELGIARETLSRSLQRLVQRDGIDYTSGRVQISSLASLEAVLEESECSCSCRC
ncbi:cAMP-binding domain of CRP or a regulatory subunit of cAMP-dependent protein kinases [Desulfuromusa kysingii]|uniref:cAMP-binding domain of CRP or a regulatory subunit of cAMP-dependent protein kinases n=1 Tax=Desulfuromusa kysingii TaxID=37625 RepID=A0A1H3VTI6_9BACT|nr:Crp/Fnr family transcriptional regulator [Desulfuromusa kysingii]SDZ78070.1 cAMP-binding domain of CRP or a regulatory subunit of cAMP-dependent protein kinases [Desulfuromusa kysingii]